ncbi:hypothetical protein NMS75_003531 [Vibrio cholerae]|nr:hypothetical protein [Vibrio cholerae]
MNLGPNTVSLAHRMILNRKGNKKIIKEYFNGKIDWSDKKFFLMKRQIRIMLRHSQDNRCIYCRRKIKNERRNSTEHIEHYLDKSKSYYKRWAFSALNLTLSCHACNIVKGTKDLGDITLRTSNNIKDGIGRFKWLHPYFDNYHDNINIDEGWVYSVKHNAPNRVAAINMISECGLDKIENIELISENIKKRHMRITLLIQKAITKGNTKRAGILTHWLILEQELNWFDY